MQILSVESFDKIDVVTCDRVNEIVILIEILASTFLSVN